MAKTTKSPNIPTKDVDVYHLGQRVDTKWAIETWLTLQYISRTNFSTKVGQLGTALGGRAAAGSGRRLQTAQEKALDKQIDNGVSKVKKYIAAKYEDEDPIPYYPQFGIEHIIRKNTSKWDFPTDRDKRYENLQLMIDAIAAHGFGAKPFGTAFWTQLQTDYKAAVDAARGTDSAVSGFVGDKKVLIEEIRTVLISILRVIEGNFPKTYHNIWREWGYLKEEN